MKLHFTYNREKDIQAILLGGINEYSTEPAKIFTELHTECTDLTDSVCVDRFYAKTLMAKNVHPST